MCTGYEFDVGIHYIGELDPEFKNRTLVDQLSDGQIEWAPLVDDYDVISFGFDPEKSKNYNMTIGEERLKASMKKQFPGEDKAIDEFLRMIGALRNGEKVLKEF